MIAPQHDPIDFTVMYATHTAFQRDLDRLVSASAAGTADSPGVRAGWENFKTQLVVHHSVEDSDLWPRVRRAVALRPPDLALIEQMEAEHAHLHPLLDAVDQAIAGPAANLAEGAQALSAAVDEHFKHEEESALPLIQSVLTPKDWRGFTAQMRRRQGVKGAAIYVPWILDGTPPADQHQLLAAMPAPVRLINRLFWQRRYRQRNLWNI